MANLVASSSVETYNVSLVAGASQVISLVNGVVNSMNDPSPPFTKSVPADAFMMSVIGTAGKWAGVRVDSDTAEFFNVPTGQALTFRIPVKKQIEVKNTSDATVAVSISFVRGRQYF